MTLKLNFAQGKVFCNYSKLVKLYKISTNGFPAKAKNERFTAKSSRCPQNLKYEYHVSRLADCVKKLPEKLRRAARAARLFFLIELIKSLICGVVVAVAVVIS